MFASFYPFKKEQTGIGRVDASLDYVYGGKTSGGSDRLVAPNTICGIDEEVIRSLGHDLGLVKNNPATIGSINVEEHLSTSQVTGITASFFDFAFAGIDASQRAYLAVRHEKRLKLSGLVSTDIHFVVLNTLLGSGSVFVPYYPKADYFGFKVWAECMPSSGRQNSSRRFPEARCRLGTELRLNASMMQQTMSCV